MDENLNIVSNIVKNLQDRIKTLEEENLNLKLNLKKENVKFNILKNIIEASTPINISQMFKDDDKELVINNYEGGNLSIIVQDFFENKKYEINENNKNRKTKVFRSVRHKQLMDEPEDEKKSNDIEIFQEQIKIEPILKNIDELFKEINSSKTYKRTLTNLKKSRSLLLCNYTLNEYTKLLYVHNQTLSNIFQKRGHDQRKIGDNIFSSLSSIDTRILYYPKYHETYLEADDMENFQKSLILSMNYQKHYTPFNIGVVYESFYNYGSVLFPIKNILKRIFVNPYGYHSLVFLDLKKDEKDPYTFYTLDNEVDNVRKWKMECRLYDITKSITINFTNYLIGIFRKIYKDVFHDNIYRPGFKKSSPIFSRDCEQLIDNLKFISDYKNFVKEFQTCIIQNCVIKPTKHDRFNFTSDDKVIKNSFKNEKNEDWNVICKRLFDEIKKEDLDTFNL